MIKLIYLITPPIIFNFLKRIEDLFRSRVNKKREIKIFDGESELFESLLKNSTVYGEYGVGNSTIFALNNSKVKIYSVDTSAEWIDNVKKSIIKNKNINNLTINHIDLGNLSDWGHPRSYSKRGKFVDYRESIWTHNLKPDLVLIDGRFRVACFLTCLKHGDIGTKIIFDDYLERERYHIVEIFLKPEKIVGRQALFKIDKEFDTEKLENLILKFEYVFD